MKYRIRESVQVIMFSLLAKVIGPLACPIYFYDDQLTQEENEEKKI